MLLLFHRYAPNGQGATHGGDESWLMDDHSSGSPDEIVLSHDMSLWWTCKTDGERSIEGDEIVLSHDMSL